MALKIEKLISSARGMGYDGGRTVLIPDTLPGEEVEYRIKRERKGVIEGEVTEVIMPSQLRIKPLCPLYGKCGGCDFQTVSPSDSASLKCDIVKDNLLRLGAIESLPPFLPPVYGEIKGYRKRARIHVNPKTGEAGFLERESSKLVRVRHCPLLDDRINALLEEDKGTLFKEARSLMFENRVNRDTGLVEVPVFCGDDCLSYGDRSVRITLGDTEYHVSANVFFQSNPGVFTKILDYVKSHTVGDTVMDLYSGVGTFSALFNNTDKTVWAVEREKKCLSLAKKNAPEALSYTDDCAKWVTKGPKTHVSTVIVDPPRTGLDRAVIDMIGKWNPERVIYVSCDPVTMCRDIALFTTHSVEEVSVYDAYYGTHHIESVALLSRKENTAKSFINIGLDAE